VRALVTGGAGFVGSNLVDRLLAEGHQVDVVDDLSVGSLANLAEARSTGDRRFTFHQLDVRSAALVDLLGRRRPEVVFHLAARADGAASLADPVGDGEVNVVGSLQVLEAARRCGARKVVFASSGAIYGAVAPASLPVRESHAQQPLSPHGVAKKAVGDYLRAYRDLHGLEYVALVLANAYGPRQDPRGSTGVVAAFAGRLLAGEPCTVHGDGTQTRDFVFVDDVVDAFARAAERGSGLLCNVGTGVETSVGTLHALMAEASGADRAPRHGPLRPGEPARSCLDPARAGLHLGWRPWTPLAEGVAAVLRWVAEGGPRAF
jgi:UDP-glucose 4-epimerase